MAAMSSQRPWGLPSPLHPQRIRIPRSGGTGEIAGSLWKLEEPKNPEESGWCVFLGHANGFCKETWEPLVQELQKFRSTLSGGGRRPLSILALDSPSHGESSVDFKVPYNYWDAAKDFGAALQRLRDPSIGMLPEDTEFLGCSISGGALKTLLSALLFPGLFSALIIMEPPIFGNDPRYAFDPDAPLARGARTRRPTFPSGWTEKDLFDYFRPRKLFRNLDERAVWSYIRGGFVRRKDALPDRRNLPEHLLLSKIGNDDDQPNSGISSSEEEKKTTKAGGEEEKIDEDEWILCCPPFAEAQFFSHGPNPYCWDRLGEVKHVLKDNGPILIVYGSESMMFPFQQILLTQLKWGPSGEHSGKSEDHSLVQGLLLNGVGHLIPMERPDIVAALISQVQLQTLKTQELRNLL